MKLCVVCGILAITCVQGQEPGGPMTIRKAIDQAVTKYPAVRAASEQIKAAAAGVNVARTAYLPRLDALGQVNRATRNNVFGMLFPQSTLPSISGPPLASNSLTSVWGSAVGVTASWEPFDFGQRRSRVEEAASGQARAEAASRRVSFEVAVRAADAWLAALANERAVQASEASVLRAKTLLTVSESLVRASLRPGVDESRSRAELARSETDVLQARRDAATARAELGGLLAEDGSKLLLDPGRLLSELPEQATEAAHEHPAITEQKASVSQTHAARTVLDRSWYPKLNLQASSYARGTGALADGRTLGGLNGLGPDIHNWAVGFTATFPLFDFASIRARTQVEVHREQAESARLDQVRQDLDTALTRARIELTTALDVARQTPIQMEASRVAEQQATARYKAGLSTIVDVADAQRLLTQAEIQDALARLTAWRALLRVSAAAGDLDLFLRQVSQ